LLVGIFLYVTGDSCYLCHGELGRVLSITPRVTDKYTYPVVAIVIYLSCFVLYWCG